MSDDPVVDRAKELLKKGQKPGASLRQARAEARGRDPLVDDTLDGYRRWEAHIGKQIQFGFHREFITGTVLAFDRGTTVVVVEYHVGNRRAMFRGTLKQLGKMSFLED